MPSTTRGAGGRAFPHASQAHPANCAYLHSAFGPGCPYCPQAVADAAPDGPAASSVHESPPDLAGVSTAHRLSDHPELAEIIYPGHDLDLGVVA
jgi:hypothetical protein